MMSRLNLTAAAGIVAFNVLFWVSLLAAPTSLPARSAPSASESFIRIAKPALLVWAGAGVIVFIVDAFRRSHKSDRGTPIGLALVGIVSFGVSSLLYYLLYARDAIRPAHEIYSEGFCPRCIAETSDDLAPATYTHDLVVGTMLLGNGDPCPDCKSRIQTLWAFVLIPLAPTGSYRVIATGPGQYVGRRTRHVNLRQVLLTYAIGLTLGGPILAWLIYSSWTKP